MAAYLWRVNPRAARIGWTSQLSRQRNSDVAYKIFSIEYFGLFTDVVVTTGQGSQTSAASVSVTNASAPITTGQGSQTSAAVVSLSTDSAIDTGQGSQSSDVAADATSFQVVFARGWLDAAIATAHSDGLWRLNPRTSAGLAGLLSQQELSQAFAGVVTDEVFGPRYTYADAFGSASIAYANRVIAPPSINDGAFGSATAYNKTQILQLSGFTQAAFGTANIYNTAQVVAPAGINQSAFGTAFAYGTTQFVYGDGFEAWAFGRPTLENANKTITMDGFANQAFGRPTVANNTRFVRPPRIDPGSFGTAEIIGPRYLSAVSVNDSAVGSAIVFGPQWAYPKLGDQSSVGEPTVSNFIRTLLPQPIAAPVGGVSTGAVVARDGDRYISPPSIDEQPFYEPIVGFDPLAVIECAGINETAFGSITIDEPASPPSGTTRYIRVPGMPLWYLAVGTPRMNPVQLKPNGINAITFGRHSVSNFIRYLKPAGISAARYGTQFISNAIRYVQPTGFDRSIVWDDFGPIDLDGRRAQVVNAREFITFPGIDQSAFGTASLSTRC